MQLDPEIDRVELHDRSRTIADRLDRSTFDFSLDSTRLWSTAIDLVDFLAGLFDMALKNLGFLGFFKKTENT